MSRNIARLQDMLAAGWDVEDLDSDHGVIEVLLRRGRASHALVLDRDDAWDIVFGEAFARPPADRASRALVVGVAH